MPKTKTLLSQRFHRVGATACTFFLILTGCSMLQPADDEPIAEINVEPRESVFMSPLEMAWEPRTPVTFAPPDVLQRLRDGFELEEVDRSHVRVDLNERTLIEDQTDPLESTDSEMVIAFWANIQIALDLLAVDDLVAILALGPETFGHMNFLRFNRIDRRF